MKVTLKNLTKIFPNKKQKSEVIAVNSFDYVIEDGELIGLLGPSGCGKSTTLNLLSGLLEPTSGSIYFGDEDVTLLPAENRGVGLVFQNYALFENMTVLENVVYAAHLKAKKEHSATKEEITARAEEMLRLLGIADLAKKYPAALSGGQQQRVAIARTLIHTPAIMLLDEPMSALDVDTRLQLRDVIKQLQADFGTTMLYITHDQEEAFAMSDRILVMGNARVAQLDTPENIIRCPADEYVAGFVVENIQKKIDSLTRFAR